MLDRDRFRDIMAAWPSGVTILATRDGARVIATTVTAFLSLSLEPPRVLAALGPNATVRPYLQSGALFGISVLNAGQRRLATIFADPFPVGDSPFTSAGAPLIDGALISLSCSVADVYATGDHNIVIGAVTAAAHRDGAALIRFRRKYHTLEI